MSNAITQGFDITVNGVTKNSLTDYGWGWENPNDFIGEPVKQSSVVSVPFGKTYDLANALNGGEPYFVSRPLRLKLGIKKYNENWRDYISDLRNTYEGREVTLTVDGDNLSWSGTAYIQNVESTRQDCRFVLFIDADAYKEGKNIQISSDDIPGYFTFPMVDGQSAVEVKTGNIGYGNLEFETNGQSYAVPLTSNTDWTLIPDLIAGVSTDVRFVGYDFYIEYRYNARSL